jgi:hypothetical protein
MADPEVIITLLKQVESRRRSNQLLIRLAAGCFGLFTLLVALNLWHLLSPISQAVRMSIAAVGVLALITWVRWQTRSRETLEVAAAEIDRRASLRNEITTAFWFINNPRASEWVDSQIHRAANRAREVDLDSTCPRVSPRMTYGAAAAAVILMIVSLLPGTARSSDAGGTAGGAMAGQSETDGQRREAIRAGLREMAKELWRLDITTDLARALENGRLDQAAQELRALVSQVTLQGPQPIKEELTEAFRRVASNTQPALELVSFGFDELATAIDAFDQGAVLEAGEQTASELERLEGEMLARLEGDVQGVGMPIETPQHEGGPPAPVPGSFPESPSDVSGSGGSGLGQTQGARIGAPTTLEVKLKQELLEAIESPLTGGPAEVLIEEASRRERSVLEYRNVSPTLAAAPQKDAVSREQIPWKYRPLIKSYFEAIRERGSEK